MAPGRRWRSACAAPLQCGPSICTDLSRTNRSTYRYRFGRISTVGSLLQQRFRGLAALSVGFLLLGGTFCSADQATENASTAESQQSSLVAVDEESENLLLKLEQQITAGHSVLPANDSALETWGLVIMRAIPASPGTARALADFVTRAQHRASDERAAGRQAVSRDLATFAALANQLLSTAPAVTFPDGLVPTNPSGSQYQVLLGTGAATTEAASRAAPGQPPDMQDHSSSAAAAVTTTFDAARAAPPVPQNNASNRIDAAAVAMANQPAPALSGDHSVGETLVRLPATSGPTTVEVASPNAVIGPAKAQDNGMAAAYYRRGADMMQVKDISAARKFYEYAANAGHVEAALALARTFDPAQLAAVGAVGLRPDRVSAALWYRRAAALGSRDAEVWLRASGLGAK
jgi:hypothetical protein